MSADAMLATGDIAQAREQIIRIEKRWPAMLGTELLAAHLALLEGRPGEAASRMLPIAESDPDNVRLQYLLIEALSRSGNIARAAELLERRVAQDPASLTARQALASLYMQQGRPDRVVTLLDRTSSENLLENESNDDLLAAARQAQGEAATAAASLSKEIKAGQDDPGRRARLAAAQTATGDPSAALVTLGPMPTGGWTAESGAARMSALVAMGNEFEINRLVDRLLDPSSGVGVDVLLAAADVAYAARQVASTSRLLDRAASLDPANTEVQLRRASLAFDARDFAKATSILEPLVLQESGQERARLALARVAEAQGDTNRARTLLEAAVLADKTAEEPALALASMELRLNRPAESSRVLDGFVAAVPDGSAARAAGLLLAEEGHFEEARTRFRQAVDREPDDALHWFNLGQSQLALVDNNAAAGSFVRAAELEPSSVAYAAAAVQLTLEAKNFAAARRTADAVAAALPGNAVAALLQGEVAQAEGRHAAAEVAFARSYSISPSAQAALGEFNARRQEKAARPDEPLKGWLAREPDDLDVRRTLSDFYLNEGMSEEAQEQLESTLKDVPNDFVALNNLAWLLRNTDRVRAEQLAGQASAIAPDNPDVADTLQTIRKINGN
jgi:predicted Zn-dependent protease